jgi:predicted nucleic acid-binding protein
MKKLNAAISLSILGVAIVLSGCSKGSDGSVLAKVNSSTITTADFKKQLEDLNPRMQQAVVTDKTARKEFLNDLIGIELVLQEAKRLGLDKDADFKKKQEALKKEAEREIQEKLKNELFNNVLKKELGDKLNQVVAPTDKDVRDYYNKNQDKIRMALGKKVSFKDIEPQLKMNLMQEKRRALYLEYANALKAKASISVDDKAMDAMIADLSRPVDIPEGLKVQKVPAPKAESLK